MRLQAQKSRKNKDYYKYVIVLPKEAVEKAGFKAGDELKAEAKKGEIKIRR